MSYERLTVKRNGKNYIETPLGGMHDFAFISHMDGKYGYTTGKAIDRLAELEDKIEDGQAVILPCKVGDMVYEVINDKYSSTLPFIQETIIEKIVITKKGLRLKLARNSFYETAVSKIGKTIFTTKEEAEAKLKELKGE